MKLKELLKKLAEHEEIGMEERRLKDGTVVYIFFAALPFPKAHEHVWYPIVVKPGQEDIDTAEIEAMLRHLWMFQLDILPEDEQKEFDA